MSAATHAANAERFAAWADRPDLLVENAQALATLAQAHATLALVEEQRTANLLTALSTTVSEALLSGKEWASIVDQLREQLRPL